MNNTNNNNVVPFPQEGDHQARVQLLDFLESGGGEHFGLTKQKYLERGDLRPLENLPGKFILEVERRRAVAGATYKKGCPSAYETYMQELIFDPVAMELEEYNEVHKGNTVDIEALASEKILEFEPYVTMIPGSSMRHVEILFWDFGRCVGTLKEAKNWVKNMIFNHYFNKSLEFYELTEAYPDIELSEYKAAYVAHVLQDLERSWENPAVPDDA